MTRSTLSGILSSVDMTLADAGEELQSLAQAGWTIHLWHEGPRSALGPLAARDPCFVVEVEGVSGYPDGFEGEGATLAQAVGDLYDRLGEVRMGWDSTGDTAPLDSA